MRFEILILIITGLIVANIYTEGKYLKLAYTWKKYYQMIGIAFVGLALCWLLRKNPDRAKDILLTSNDYLRYLPVDKNVTSMVAPILNFSAGSAYAATQSNPYMNGGRTVRGGGPDVQPQYQKRLHQSGKKSTKRSVSETKKKFVAARQGWCCGDCKKQLSAWFEVDHTIRLENGGSNHIDNLVALCRECHGKKTAIENL